ncbi:MAG: transglutaminaseTgpA domain-containing protein [Ornithinimicrobium sp.]|uniref:transglutaminase family protein n=1 Tax=Ornithinimicrobium sp. TaxID=1977084 RepID=UPI003D9AF198
MKLERGLWPEALVAALASLSVAWPLTTLLQAQSWLAPAIVLVAAVATTGGVLRTVRAAPSVVSLGQLAVGGLGIAAVYLPQTLWYGVPTPTTVRGAAELLREAGTVLSTYAAPAPTTTGVSFLVVAVLVLTATSVDTIGVTGRSPAVAGIPLAAAFLVSVSNSGEAMQPWFFAATGATWMLMVVQQGERLVESWPSRGRREFVAGDDVSHGRTGHRSSARLLGVATLALALLGAGLLPHLPPTYFAQGLARNPDANDLGGGGGEVSFVETMDPAADLRSQSTATVLRYTSSARALEPLKVTATEVYQDGEWQPPQRRRSELIDPPTRAADPVSELAPGVVTRGETIRVAVNSLRPPHLAAPAPLTSLDTEGAPWLFDTRAGVAQLSGRPVADYTAGYLSLAPVDEMPADVGARPATPELMRPELLDVPEAALPAVQARAAQVVGEQTEPLQQAIAIQNHLRGGDYVYSLELADARPDVVDEPISQFLASGQGYCVQFATAMVMMARSEGIPARMAVGFLPGELQGGSQRRVVAADAHTWPELWLEGLGWTRFEPTPGTRTGPAPGFTRSFQDPGAQFPAPQAVPEVDVEEPAPQEPPAQDSTLQQVLTRAGLVLLALVVVGLLMLLVPLAGRRFREREVRTARTAREQVEAQWLLLTRSLSDLGVPPAPPQSPRAMRSHYAEHTELDRRGHEALGRVTQTLERTRYAGPGRTGPASAPHLNGDVRTVIDRVRESSSGTVRARARWLPRTGWHGLRSIITRR